MISLPGCLPRWETARTAGRETYGPLVNSVALDLVGRELMPWQQQVANVALEVDPETKLLAYRQVVLTVPRQSGKTTLLLAVMVHRALSFGGRQRIIYTAQDRLSAHKKWENEHVPLLESSRKMRGRFTIRRQRGEESIRWRNGSLHSLTAPTEKATHGDVLDLAVIDEAFAREDDRVEQGMKPAMITRDQPQLWIVSTAGNRKSAYLRGKVEAGRSAVEMGVDRGIAYFEWSARPDEDPGSIETWRRCMPALGHTIKWNAIQADFQTMELDEFRRAYLNQWQEDASDDWDVISKATWGSLKMEYRDRPYRPAFAVDVNPDRTWAAIGVCGRQADGNLSIEIDRHDRGTSWIVPRLKELQAKWRPCAIVIAPSTPAGNWIQEAEAAGLEVEKPTTRDIAHGCASLFDGTGSNPEARQAPWIRHRDQIELNAAVAGAQKREYGDIWLWARKGVSVDISPLVAVTLALWGYQEKSHVPEEVAAEPWVFTS
jgi:Phage Terminase